MKNRILLAQAGFLCAINFIAAQAQAQGDGPAGQPQEASARSGDRLGDIVVTARRRSEKLQDVPIDVVAVSGETLKNADIRSTLDLTTVVPGLRANNQVMYFQPFIRGVGGSSTLPGNESPVAFYVDGVYVAMKDANTFELNNIERIEVLKGPQGTLFGRNATGGAINIITRAPSDRLEARWDVTYGRFDDVIANTYLSGPLTNTLAASASLRYENIGKGYQRNIVTGSPFGLLRSFSGMAKLRWQPVPQLTVVGEFIYTRRNATDDDQATPNAAIQPKGARVPGAIVSYTPYVVALNNDPQLRLNDKKGILDVRYDFGGVRLLSLTGYVHGDFLSQTERDRSSAVQQFTSGVGIGRQFSQEIQLQSDTKGRFSWIVGAYYFRNREGFQPFLTLLNTAGNSLSLPALAAAFGKPGASAALVNSTQYVRSIAGFAEANYEFTRATRLTLGFRYTDERRRLTGARQLVTAPPPGNVLVFTTASTVDLSTTFSKPTWRVTLDHHFSPDLMAYASYNRGFRSGAYNPTSISQTQVPLKPEVIDAYEVGIKSELLGHRLRLNGAAFYYNYRDLHVSVRTPSTGIIVQQNAGGAEIYGLDLDFAAQLFHGLSLNGGVNLLHARYSDFQNASTFAVDPVNGGGVQVTIPNAAGQPLSYAPNFTANLGIDYEHRLADGGRVVLSGNYFITSSFSRQVGMVLGVEEVQGYDNLNASLTWHSPGDRYFLRAWGRNLTDHRVLGSTLDSFAYFYVVQRPITYGLTLGFSFGG